ncbi:hypothetical protein CYMTET_40579 [Cymbomonas tetramitiformis]|uniref:Uncharacterized protein n=1 Tax=Cymbomonas tetramitiformis TaxID=36881 RepID=A0AAE0F3H1_9CHLO|nr:hypothetical protein CYMTET_40579 [Cymbomonas tetramitiformis]
MARNWPSFDVLTTSQSNVGLTLDTADAESDFAVLLDNMKHVFGPISRDEILRLLDLDYEYDKYHLTLNELIYGVLVTVLLGTALVLYEESAHVHPHDGRCALQRLRFHVEGIGDPDTCRFWVRLRAIIIDETVEPALRGWLSSPRTLAPDKHRKLHPDYGDINRVDEDLHNVLRTSAAHSPYVTPLYLVVVRDLNSGQRLTFAALTLRLGRVFRDESPFACLTVTPSPAAPGGGGRGGGGKSVVGSINAFSKSRRAPPELGPPPQQDGSQNAAAMSAQFRAVPTPPNSLDPPVAASLLDGGVPPPAAFSLRVHYPSAQRDLKVQLIQAIGQGADLQQMS